MVTQLLSLRLQRNRRIIVGLLFTLILPLTILAPISPTVPRAQPLLLQRAIDHPDALTNVIVRKLTNASTAESAVMYLGGQVLKPLHMINGFAAVLPARNIAQLGRSADVGWISQDAMLESSDCQLCQEVDAGSSPYIKTVGADRAWDVVRHTGSQHITVAVIDSGVAEHPDLADLHGEHSRVNSTASFPRSPVSAGDNLGHGTHVAGIIAGNGAASAGAVVGMASFVNIVSVKVTDDRGMATMSDLMNGLQWVYENAERLNIRVLNLSMNSTVAESYHTSPLSAALELLWMRGIVVVVSAGNHGPATMYPPANDPFVITVGATDDRRTPNVIADFSSYATTSDGFTKPDIVSPGRGIVSLLAGQNALIAQGSSANILDDMYIRMSGTSVSAPIVSGAVALVLADEPMLNPDQVKARLIATAKPMAQPGAGAGTLDAYSAVTKTNTGSANDGIQLTQLLWNHSTTPVFYNARNWTSTTWASRNWTSTTWTSRNWTSGAWGLAQTWSSRNWTSFEPTLSVIPISERPAP
ncbi:MAG: hypothetical protein NVS4B8_01610 [Herpetosiphon sp.]